MLKLRALAVLAALISAPLAADAQDWPNRPVHFIVPFAAGGSTDVLARMAADHLNKSYGQVFIVDDRPGATGTIA